MGRKRNNSIGIWLSDEEFLKIKNRSLESNLNQGAYIRKCVLDKKITVIPGIRELVIELKRVGNNLNQLTRSVNEGSLKVINDDLETIKEDLKCVWEKLYATLKKI